MKKISILLLVVAVVLIGVGVFITFQKDENSNSNKQVDVAKLDVLDKAKVQCQIVLVKPKLMINELRKRTRNQFSFIV